MLSRSGASPKQRFPGSDAAGSLPQAQLARPAACIASSAEPISLGPTQDLRASPAEAGRTIDASSGLVPSHAAPDPGSERGQAPSQLATSSAATKRSAPKADSSQGLQVHWASQAPEPSDRQAKRHRVAHGQLPYNPQTVLLDGTSARQWLRVIKLRLQSFGGFQSLNSACEKLRYELLYHASANGDIFYIILHQILCLWGVNRESVFLWLSSLPSAIDSAFGLLFHILRSNSQLPPAHLHWFASFPLDFQRALGHRLISQVVSQISSFINNFTPSRWEHALALVCKRRYPFLVCELRSNFMSTSSVLQRVLFTSSCERLDIGDGAASELYQLFAMDCNNEARQSDFAETARLRATMAARYVELASVASGTSTNFACRLSNPRQLTHRTGGHNQTHMHVQGFPGSSMPPCADSVYPATQARFPCPPPTASAPLPQPSFNVGSNHGNARFFVPSQAEYRAAVTLPWGNAMATAPAAPSNPMPGHTFATGQTHPLNAASFGQPSYAYAVPIRANQRVSQNMPRFASTRPASHQGSTAAGLAAQDPPADFWLRRHTTAAAAPAMASRPLASHPQLQQIAPASWQPLSVSRSDMSSALVGNQQPSQTPSQTPAPRQPAAGEGHAQSTTGQTRRQYRTVPLGEHEYPQSDFQCIQNSLHLWYLRSPKRAPLKPCSGRFYQFMTHFAVEPRDLPPRKGPPRDKVLRVGSPALRDGPDISFWRGVNSSLHQWVSPISPSPVQTESGSSGSGSDPLGNLPDLLTAAHFFGV